MVDVFFNTVRLKMANLCSILAFAFWRMHFLQSLQETKINKGKFGTTLNLNNKCLKTKMT